jgi:hypothetical protein
VSFSVMLNGGKKMERKIGKATIMVAVLLAGMAFLMGSGGSQSGLIGWWKFDEGSGTIVYDSSGDGNHGTIYGATWIHYQEKTRGYWYGETALNFDGIDDYVEIPNFFPYNESGTATMWVKPAFEPNDGLTHWLIDGGVDSDTGFWWAKRSDNTLCFNIRGNSPDTPITYPVNSSIFGNNTWHHVAITWWNKGPGNSEMRMYLDGNLVNSTSSATVPDRTRSSMLIGISIYYDRAWKGIIDDVRVYDRALSEEEIKKVAEIHDTAVVDMRLSKSVVGESYSLNINVTVANQGVYAENVSVAIFPFYPSYPTPEQSETFWSMGDVNRDGYIDQIDLELVVKWFGFTNTSPADLNKDGTVNVKDVFICVQNQGKDIYTYFNFSPKPVGRYVVINLLNGTSTTISFVWNTTSFAAENLTAYAAPVPGETEISDNTFKIPHHIAVTKADASKTIVGQGYTTSINVTVANQGGYDETFDVTLYTGSESPINVPLLEDNFDDGVIDSSIWSSEVARVGYGIWKIREYGTSPPFITASEENGKLRLSGYGYSYYNYDRVLISKRAFSGAFTLEVEMTSLTGSGTAYGGGIVIVKDDFTAMHLRQDVSYWYEWPSDYRDFSYVAVESVIDGTPEAPPSPGGIGTPHLGEGQVKAPGPVTYPIKLKCIYDGINEFKLYWIMGDQTFQTTYISPETFDTYRIVIWADARLGEDYVDAEFDNLKLYGSQISETGLVGYWNFDEGAGTIAHDSSGNNNDGMLMNGPTWVDGKIGKALYFDGTDDYIRIEDSATISSPSVTNAITVMAWVKPDPGFLDRYARVVASHWTDGEGQIGGSSNAWVLEAHDDGRYHAILSAGDDVTWIDLASNTAPQEGVWQHLAFTWDGSTVTFYFNGVIDATGMYTATISDSSRPMQITKTDLLWYVWKGFIDEIKVYNRSLSAEEVWAEYTRQAGFIIGTQTVTLESGASTTLTFTWNTTGFAKGNYTLWAYAWPVLGETDTADNTFVDGWVVVAMPGDINADGIVDIFDCVRIALAFSATPHDPNWDPNADIDNSNLIDIFDLVIVAIHFAETDP